MIVRSPAIVTLLVPVGIAITFVSASFLIVTSFVLPCPVKISPSPDVYPIAALSPAAVSPDASTVLPVITPEAFTVVVVRVVIVAEVCVPPTTPLIVGAVTVSYTHLTLPTILLV